MTDDPFVAHRGLLFTVAYEMLGSAGDAEDVVQETWLRWADVDHAEVRDPRAYLVRMVTRQALNRLRTVSRQREDYVGEWLPEPLLTSPDVAEDAELAENVSIAMLTVLETLGPAERAVFVLHEVFETPFARDRRGRGQDPGRGPADRAPCPRARGGATAADAGGPSRAGGNPPEVHGRRYLRRRSGTCGSACPGCGVDRRWWRPSAGCSYAAHRGREGSGVPGPVADLSDLVATTAWLNGMPGARFNVAGDDTAVSLVIENVRITRIFAIRNPNKLGRLEEVAELRR